MAGDGNGWPEGHICFPLYLDTAELLTGVGEADGLYNAAVEALTDRYREVKAALAALAGAGHAAGTVPASGLLSVVDELVATVDEQLEADDSPAGPTRADIVTTYLELMASPDAPTGQGLAAQAEYTAALIIGGVGGVRAGSGVTRQRESAPTTDVLRLRGGAGGDADLDIVSDWMLLSARRGSRRSPALLALDEAVAAYEVRQDIASADLVLASVQAWRAAKKGKGSNRDAAVDQLHRRVAEEREDARAEEIRSKLLRSSLTDPAVDERFQLLGPDLFGVRRVDPAPGFLRSVQQDNLDTTQLRSFFRALDLGQEPPRTLVPGLLPQDGAMWVARFSGARREWGADSYRLPDEFKSLPEQVEAPKLFHSIWLGSPFDGRSQRMQSFQENLGRLRLHAPAGAEVLLWTDIPRHVFDDVRHGRTPRPGAGYDPAGTEQMLEWARRNNVILAGVEVFHEDAPMVNAALYKQAVARLLPDGSTQASDILRWEILHRFGGVYTDSDNEPLATGQELDDILADAFGSTGAAVHKFPRDHGGGLNNSAVMTARRHPLARAMLDTIADNYQLDQLNLYAKSKHRIRPIPNDDSPVTRAAVPEWAQQRGLITRRRSVLLRTGPEALELLDVRDAVSDLNGAFSLGQANTWLTPPLPYSAWRKYGRADEDFVVQRVVSTLARGLYNRQGDLHLAGVAPVVLGLPDPSAAWRAVTGFIMDHPQLAGRVQTVSDRMIAADGQGGTTIIPLDLPHAVYEHLAIEPSADEPARSGHWWLGELMRPVGTRAVPRADDGRRPAAPPRPGRYPGAGGPAGRSTAVFAASTGDAMGTGLAAVIDQAVRGQDWQKAAKLSRHARQWGAGGASADTLPPGRAEGPVEGDGNAGPGAQESANFGLTGAGEVASLTDVDAGLAGRQPGAQARTAAPAVQAPAAAAALQPASFGPESALPGAGLGARVGGPVQVAMANTDDAMAGGIHQTLADGGLSEVAAARLRNAQRTYPAAGTSGGHDLASVPVEPAAALPGRAVAGMAPRRTPLRLSEVLPPAEWWRLYIAPDHHDRAIEEYPADPGSLYDHQQSPGFQRAMTQTYRTILDQPTPITGGLNWERYQDLLRRTTSGDVPGKFRVGQPGHGFPLEARGLAEDVSSDLLDGRPLLVTEEDFERREMQGAPLPLTELGVRPDDSTEPAIVALYDADETGPLVDKIFDKFRAEIAGARDDHERLRAIAWVVRFLHVLHPFVEGNGRVNIFLLLPKLLMEHGFKPLIPGGTVPAWIGGIPVWSLFNGGHSLDMITRELRRAQRTRPVTRPTVTIEDFTNALNTGQRERLKTLAGGIVEDALDLYEDGRRMRVTVKGFGNGSNGPARRADSITQALQEYVAAELRATAGTALTIDDLTWRQEAVERGSGPHQRTLRRAEVTFSAYVTGPPRAERLHQAVRPEPRQDPDAFPTDPVRVAMANTDDAMSTGLAAAIDKAIHEHDLEKVAALSRHAHRWEAGGGDHEEAPSRPLTGGSGEPLTAPEPETPVTVLMHENSGRPVDDAGRAALWLMADRLVDSGAARRETGKPVRSAQITGFGAGPSYLPRLLAQREAMSAGLWWAKDVHFELVRLIEENVKGRSAAWRAATRLTSKDDIRRFTDQLVPKKAALGERNDGLANQVTVSVTEEPNLAPRRLEVSVPLQNVDRLRRGEHGSFAIAAVARFLAAAPRHGSGAFAQIVLYGTQSQADLARADELRRYLVALVREETAGLGTDTWAEEAVLRVETPPGGDTGSEARAVVTVRSRDDMIVEENSWLSEINPGYYDPPPDYQPLPQPGPGDRPGSEPLPQYKKAVAYNANCLFTTIAVDQKLATGTLLQVGPTAAQFVENLRRYAPDRPWYVTTWASMLEAMRKSRPGSRGVLQFGIPGGGAHFVNVVRHPRLGVIFPDGQTGKELRRAWWPSGEANVILGAMSDGIPRPSVVNLNHWFNNADLSAPDPTGEPSRRTVASRGSGGSTIRHFVDAHTTAGAGPTSTGTVMRAETHGDNGLAPRTERDIQSAWSGLTPRERGLNSIGARDQEQERPIPQGEEGSAVRAGRRPVEDVMLPGSGADVDPAPVSPLPTPDSSLRFAEGSTPGRRAQLSDEGRLLLDAAVGFGMLPGADGNRGQWQRFTPSARGIEHRADGHPVPQVIDLVEVLARERLTALAEQPMENGPDSPLAQAVRIVGDHIGAEISTARPPLIRLSLTDQDAYLQVTLAIARDLAQDLGRVYVQLGSGDPIPICRD